MKKYFRILFVLTLLFSLFSFVSVLADGNQLSLDSINVKDKSYKVGITKLKVKNGEVDNNMFFNKVGDYINYDVVINNNSDKNYTIKDITNDSNNQYITYDYSNYKDKVIEAGKSVTLNIKATYSNQAPTKVLGNTPVNFSILYDDGTGILNTLNVNTGDHILGYVILFILSAGGLVLTIVYDRKHVTSYLVLVLSIGVLIPISTKADSHNLTFKMNNDISEKSVALLDTGMNVNLSMIKLVTGDNPHWVYDVNYDEYSLFVEEYTSDTVDNDDDYFNYYYDYSDITQSIINATREDYDYANSHFLDIQKISLDGSDNDIYVWFNNSMYFYTGADVIMLNEDSSCLFMGFSNISSVDLSKYNTSNVKKIEGMFFKCFSLNNIDVSSFYTSNVIKMNHLFKDCSSLQSIDLINFDTSNVIDMSYMFDGCQNLLSVDVSHFDTSKVTDMCSMFYDCFLLSYIDVSNFDTRNVIDMACMFRNCNSVTLLDVSNFDTSKVTSMSGMFGNCNSLTSLDVSRFITNNVEDMGSMFFNCCLLTVIDVSNFDTSNVTDMNSMFGYCLKVLELNLSSFNTSKVTDMSYMFYDCKSLTSLDLSNFDKSSLVDRNSMFAGMNFYPDF